jgi:mono/diheme cytochrome c family protein
MNPQLLSPGSRMPSYAHLFGHGDSRGDDLVAYLNSLGQDTHDKRQEQVRAWNASNDVVPISARYSNQLFQESCAQCHGISGNGNGTVAGLLRIKPRDLVNEPLKYVPVSSDNVILRSALTRIIKFGISGTSMPGHEYLTDAEISGLAEYVTKLHAIPQSGKSPRTAIAGPSDLYHRNCAHCHGETGRGNGIFSANLKPPPRDLAVGESKYVDEDSTPEVRRRQLIDLIRNGIPATSMPGHGHLADEEIESLVVYIENLKNTDQYLQTGH